MILVDAGPLVALLHDDDKHHTACQKALASLREPLATLWPPIVEAMYLLSFSGEAQDALLEMVESGTLALFPLEPADTPRLRFLMNKYRDLPMDLADAALVCVAERERIGTVFTLDRRDFDVYRPRGIGRFAVLPP